MKIQLLSDIHWHPYRDDIGFLRNFRIEADVDVFVVAGDWGSLPGAWILAQLEAAPKAHILFIAGNHEFYGGDWNSTLPLLKRQFSALPQRVHFLEKETFFHEGVRFPATTLWSPISSRNAWQIQASIGDYHAIYKGGTHSVRITPDDVNKRYQENSIWLQQELQKPFEGKTVVVTHHMPIFALVAPKWRGSPLNDAFAAKCDSFFGQSWSPEAWIFGHTHDTVLQVVRGTLCAANPYGYQHEVEERGHPLPPFLIEI